MSSIILTKAALSKLAQDPRIRAWREGKSDGKVPLLSYYQRSYTTLHDGTIVEHGDGFSLAFVDPGQVKASKSIALDRVALPEQGCILVGGDRSVLRGDFSIGWSDAKFTFEPHAFS